jgi:hypothetical protein
MVLCLQNKSIIAWWLILVPVLTGLLLSKYQGCWNARKFSLPRGNRRKARPMLDPSSISPAFKIKLALMMRPPRRNFCQYAYDKLWLVEYKASCHLQFVSHQDLTIVWPNGKPQSCDKHVLISTGQRCSCCRRIAFGHQCRHELCIAGKLDLAKYSTPWLNHRPFNVTMTPTNPQLPLFPSATNPLSASHHHSMSVIDNKSSLLNAFDDAESRNSADEDFKDVVTLLNSDSHSVSKHGKLTYQFVAEKASNLVWLAQSDPIKMGSLSNLLEQLTSRLGNSQSIAVQS